MKLLPLIGVLASGCVSAHSVPFGWCGVECTNLTLPPCGTGGAPRQGSCVSSRAELSTEGRSQHLVDGGEFSVNVEP